MVAVSSGEGGPHLGIGQAACECGVASIPQVGRQVADRFFGEQLHEGAGVEVDQPHISAAAQRRSRPEAGVGAAARMHGGAGPPRGADYPIGRQALERGRGGQAEQPGYRNPPVGDHDFVTLPDPFEPLAEVRTQFSDSYVHNPILYALTDSTYVQKCQASERPAVHVPTARLEIQARSQMGGSWPVSCPVDCLRSSCCPASSTGGR